MKKIINRNLIIFLIPFIVLFYTPSTTNFFSSDDWFHLRITQINSFSEFINFFVFTQTPQSATFYRPLSTQLFFYFFQTFFGLNPIPYHLFILFIFSLSLYLLFQFTKIFTGNTKIAFLSVFFYGFASSNFSRIYFLSHLQEPLLVFFTLLTLIWYLKKESTLKSMLITLLFFVGALGSKETAVIIPGVLILIDLYRKKINLKKIFPFVGLAVIYLFFRLVFFGVAKGDSYIWDFSALKTINSAFWYFLWSLGAPEFLVDYVASGLKIVPRLFQVLPVYAEILLSVLLLQLLFFIILFIRNIKQRLIIFTLVFFTITLLPFLFLPWHKFTVELGLPMIGISVMFSILSVDKRKILAATFILLFLGLNILSHFLMFKTHYIITRAKISSRVFEYFKSNYPELPTDKTILFTNNIQSENKNWGVSKQVSLATSNSEMFRAMYKNPNIVVYFEDNDEKAASGSSSINLPAIQFLK